MKAKKRRRRKIFALKRILHIQHSLSKYMEREILNEGPNGYDRAFYRYKVDFHSDIQINRSV